MATDVVRIPTVPHTPANEWANETAMTLSSTLITNTGPVTPGLDGISSSAVSTPGHELPGGWGAVTRAVGSTPGESGPSTTIYQNVTTALSNVGQTAFNMIPSGLKDSVSSSPDKGAVAGARRDVTGGVGDLPGGPDDGGVAKLPLERQVDKEQGVVGQQTDGTTALQSTVDAANSTLASASQAVSNAAGYISNNAWGKKDVKFDSAEVVPPTVVPTTTGAGVGDLPGAPSETGIAKLPLEREAENDAAPDNSARYEVGNKPPRRTEELDGLGQEALVTPVGGGPAMSTAAAFLDRRIPTPDPAEPPKSKIRPDPAIDFPIPKKLEPVDTLDVPDSSSAERISTDSDVKNAALNSDGGLQKFEVSLNKPYDRPQRDSDSLNGPVPPPKDDQGIAVSPVSSGTKFAEQVVPPPEHVHSRGHNRTGSTSSSGGSKSKISFREKIKGEIKVLSGKVTKNEAKVEEGKAILAGGGGHT